MSKPAPSSPLSTSGVAGSLASSPFARSARRYRERRKVQMLFGLAGLGVAGLACLPFAAWTQQAIEIVSEGVRGQIEPDHVMGLSIQGAASLAPATSDGPLSWGQTTEAYETALEGLYTETSSQDDHGAADAMSPIISRVAAGGPHPEASTDRPDDLRLAEASREDPEVAAEPINETASPEIPTPLPRKLDAEPPEAPQVAQDGIWVVAQDAAWVQIQTRGGRVIQQGVMTSGDRWSAGQPEAPTILRAGNAGAVFLEIDGVRYGPLGQPDGVVSQIPMTADAIQARFPLETAY